jgi:dTDP-4-amino-4,6-dideoxygalactose transaminase
MCTNGNRPSQAIPFLDLATPHRELEADLVSVFKSTLATGGFVGGPIVEDFEQAYARFCGSSFCIGVASGTDALRFALIAAGLQRGDVVLTVPNTFIATTEAISQAGGIPEFVDIDERTYNIDPQRRQDYLAKACKKDPLTGRMISRRNGRPITTIVPVHLYGQMADMDEIMKVAAAHNLLVVEDSCQAHGAEYFSQEQKEWKKAGSFGHAAAFSFYPGKNLGACGEAGAVTTNSAEMARMVKMIRDHGQKERYFHQVEGYNGRLDAIQAGILNAKLKHLSKWNDMRCSNARRYDELLEPYADFITKPFQALNSRHVYHLYVVRVGDRDGLRAAMCEANIGTGIHYPVPLHLQNACSYLSYKAGDFPITEQIASEIISLPMHPHLKSHEQARVVNALAEHLERTNKSWAQLSRV